MEIHHHAHTPRKKWSHYFWEFFMLFLAVTLGFLVENKREHFIEHKRAKGYAVLLKLDLMKDTMDLNKYIHSKEIEFEKMARKQELYEKDEDKITIGDLRFMDTSTFIISPFRTHNATLAQLKSSGSLRYFENLELKNLLANYEWEITNVNELYNHFIGLGGGLQSDYILQYNIHLFKFLKKSESLPDNLPANEGGYKFNSWMENNAIVSNMMEVMQFMTTQSYPNLKKSASKIIDILNKEFNLK